MSTRNIHTDCVGLVVALPAEARSLGLRHLRPGGCARWRHGWAAMAGVGCHNAMHAAERLLACGVTQLANWGVAGALDADLQPGDVLVPDRIRYADDDATGFIPDPDFSAHTAHLLAGNLRVSRGVLWSARRPLASRADKQALAQRSGAIAVDMEAAAVAAVATRAKLPFVAVKSICDPLARELPARIVQALDGAGGGFSLRMVAAITLGGPATWRAARSLAADFARARHSLATAARLVA